MGLWLRSCSSVLALTITTDEVWQSIRRCSEFQAHCSVQGIHDAAWWGGKPIRQYTINHRHLAESSKPVDYKIVPSLLQAFAKTGYCHIVSADKSESLVSLYRSDDRRDYEAHRDAILKEDRAIALRNLLKNAAFCDCGAAVFV